MKLIFQVSNFHLTKGELEAAVSRVHCLFFFDCYMSWVANIDQHLSI